MHVFNWLHNLSHDMRYAVRALRKSPGFTAVAVVTLALGIGANTAIFSAVNAALLRPLPYRDPDRLVWITEIWHKEHDNALVPNPDYTDWNTQARSFEQMAAYDGGEELNLTGGREPLRVETAGVTPNFFHTLGVEPLRGRGFRQQEALPGGPAVAILSYDLWRRRFGLDPDILGKAITLDNQSYTVVGIMPAGFRFPDQDLKPQCFIPFQLPPAVNWNAEWLTDTYVLARLRSGIGTELAQAELQAINKRDFAQVSAPFVAMGRRTVQVHVSTLQAKLVGDVRTPLLVLLGAVGFVLLIACANIANLQLVRTTARRQEFAVRAAIGAGRARLVRQLLTENAVLGAIGGALGLLVGVAGVKLLHWLGPPDLTHVGDITVDLRVLVFTFAITCLVSVMFGTLPALAGSREGFFEALKRARSQTSEHGGRRIRKVLATGELALALVVLAGSGLLLRSFVLLSQVDPGFDPHHVLTARLKLPETQYPKAAQQRAFFEQILQRLSRLPGVKSVGLSNAPPWQGYAGEAAVRFRGEPPLPPGAAPSVPVTSISPDYFSALHIPLIAGRFFDQQDGTHGDLPIIVNQSFARRFFPQQDAIGKQVCLGGPTWPWRTIIGVVGDVRHQGLDRVADAQLYRPYAATDGDPMGTAQSLLTATLTLRCRTSPLGLAAVLRREVAHVDPELPVFDLISLDQRLEDSLSAPRFNATLLAIFAGFALLLAVVGIYGVIAFLVAQRRHEIGIRMALGAMPKSILRLLMAEAVVIVVLGLALGLAGAVALTRYLVNLLFAIRPTDPITLIGVCLVLIAVTLAASYLPARRAMKVDPMVALRYE